MNALQSFDVFTTWGHRARFKAESAEHAELLFLGKVWPPGIPPAPQPAHRVIPHSGGLTEQTPEWHKWYQHQFLPVRKLYPVLAWAHGECMSRILPAGQGVCHGQFNTSTARWVECNICPKEIVQ